MTDRVNLADVAKSAGVHVSTASRALNPETRSVVSDATVAKVVEAAQRLGYRPHPLARGLRTDRTFTVGIVVPDLENPLFPPLVRGAEGALGGEGYSLLVGNTDNDREHTAAVVSTLVDQRVDGLILATAEIGDELLPALRQEGVTVVLVNREGDDASIPAVVGDDHAGIGLAVDHLVELGHRVVGHVAGPARLSTGVARAAAFRAHTERHGVDGSVEVAEWFQMEPGYTAAASLLNRRPELTAIVAANDLLALGTCRAVADSGRRVPQDVSVVGYNDMPFVDLIQPPLTTVRVPFREMGALAAKTLLAIFGGETVTETVRMAPELCVRGSTARAR